MVPQDEAARRLLERQLKFPVSEWEIKLKLDRRQRVLKDPVPGETDWFQELTDEELREAFSHKPLCDIVLTSKWLSKLTAREMRRLKSVLAIHNRAFARSSVATRTHKLELDIRCKNDNPVESRLWRKDPISQQEIYRQTKKMRKHHIIENSNSQWAANVVLADKKDGTKRFAVDYRKVSKQILYAPYPIPNIQTALDALGGCKYFSMLDFLSAYFQLPLNKRSMKYTAFRTQDGLYHFTCMPFGLNLAPHEWAKAVDMCIGSLRHECAQTYFDDILCHSKTFEDHLQHLHKVFVRVEEYGFVLKPSKCEFCRDQFTYLGHLVSKDGVTADPTKVKAVAAILASDIDTVKKLDAFLGLTGYLRRYVDNYQKLAKPLYDLRQLGGQFTGLDEAGVEAFETLKTKLVTPPILAHPDFTQPFEVHTDASKRGLGATLVQHQAGKERVIAYASRALRQYEKRYFPYKLECAAIIFALKQFHIYLKHRKFTLITDHKALLKLLHGDTNPAGVLDLWLSIIQGFDFEIKHRKGKRHGDADALSRLKPLPTSEHLGVPANSADVPMIQNDKSVIVCPMLTRSQRRDTPNEAPGTPKEESKEDSPEPDEPSFEEEFKEYLEAGDSELGDEPNLEATIRDVKRNLGQEALPDTDTLKQMFTRPFKDIDLDRFTTAGVAQKQLEDPFCIEMRQRVEKQQSRAKRFFVDERGILCYKPNLERPDSLVVLPKSLVPTLLSIYHDLPLAAHRGRYKTYAAVCKRWWWKGRYTDVRNKVRGCVRCLRRKASRPLKAGLTELHLATHPFQRIHVDVYGTFAQTPEGETKVMTIVDAFTNWVIAVPVVDETKETFADVIYNHVITKHGCPREIVTDKASGFIAEVMTLIAKRLGINKITTSGYMPQSNGKVERYHRFLGASLTIYCVDKQHWKPWLQAVVFAYNSSVVATTGFSPFELVYGRRPVMPLDLLMDKPQGGEYRDETQYGIQVSTALRDIFVRVRADQLSTAESRKRYRDRNRREVTFEPGTWVLYWEPEKPPKLPLAPRKMGVGARAAGTNVPQKLLYNFSLPCRVVKQTDTNQYLVENPWRGRTTGKVTHLHVHVSKMVPYNPWDGDEEDWKATMEREQALLDSNVEEEEEDVDVVVQPAPGMLAIIRLDKKTEPFAVAKLLKKDEGTWTVQWYGNSSRNVLGVHHPGFIDSKDGRPYHSRTPMAPSHKVYTNHSDWGKVKVHRSNIRYYDFKLTSSGRLSMQMLRLLSADNDINWKHPKL